VPAYEALSYTRAAEAATAVRCCPIFIGPQWDVVYVTLSCKEALQGIRRHDSDRLIWIDSICINQDDADDKTHQVGLRPDIYKNASSVIIYLGNSSSDTDVALDFLSDSAARPLFSCRTFPVDQEAKAALKNLFQRPYFSSIWAMPEILCSKQLKITCGQHSVLWPEALSLAKISGVPAPSWMFDRNIWHQFTSQDLLRLLVDNSQYKCVDPRDKVFAILGLIHEKRVFPDYRLPVEQVYLGITAYLVKNCLRFEVLALAGRADKDIELPSWVPDYSQDLAPLCQKDLGYNDRSPSDPAPLVFNSIRAPELEISVDCDSGSLRISAVKLCDLVGKVKQTDTGARIFIPVGWRDTLILNTQDKMYEIGNDSLFLLAEWTRPVILRRRAGTNLYCFVSQVSLSVQLDLRWPITWLTSWENLFLSEIGVDPFSSAEDDQLTSFHSWLTELCNLQPPPSPEGGVNHSVCAAKPMILDFLQLSSSGLPKIEARLRREWDDLSQQLGWMFLDQAAIRNLLHEVSSGNLGDATGEARTVAGDTDAEFDQRCRLPFKWTYRWDLARFCSSFLRPVLDRTAETESASNPMIRALKSQLHEVQKWAETTEQLLNLFAYSGIVLKKSWSSFPGAELQDKWLQNVDRDVEPDSPTSGKQPADYRWDWSAFKHDLNLRARIWSQPPPPLLDPWNNRKAATHVALRSLGLDLYCETVVTIV
jgi:hypothetical protein